MSIPLNEFLSIFSTALDKNQTVLACSRPGVGKTVGMTELALKKGFEVLLGHPVGYDPTDMRGFPALFKEEGVAKFLPYGDFSTLLHATKPTLFIFDDLGQQVSTLVQGSLMQPLEAKEINGQHVPKCVRFAAATNRQKDGAGVAGIIQPLLNRFDMIIEIEPHVPSWIDYISSKGYSQGPMLCAFIQHRPKWLLEWEPTKSIEASATPRTLEKALRLLDAGYPAKHTFEILKGCIGEPCAVEYLAFARLANEFPDFDVIEQDPMRARVPDNKTKDGLQAMYALCGALAQRLNKKNVDNVLTYMERFPAEFRVLGIRFAWHAHEDVVANSPVFQQHALKHADLYASV